jgi:hypothetical protein
MYAILKSVKSRLSRSLGIQWTLAMNEQSQKLR